MSNTNVVPQGLFGPGILFLTRTDIANGTPYNVGFVNEFSYDFSFDTKELYGQNQFALLAARGTAKATGKIKAATLSGQALNSLLLGGAWTAGTQYDLFVNPSTAIPTTPYQITPPPPNSGTWNSDLGVVNAATLEPLTQVASAPAAGQYSVAAGVYTFSSADHTAGVSVIISISYSYTTGATGMNQVVANSLIGTTPTFQLDYRTILYGASYYIRFYNCIGGKWGMAHKITDFAMPEYDFLFFANAAQNIMLMSTATQA
jgi:hypothetical protein